MQQILLEGYPEIHLSPIYPLALRASTTFGAEPGRLHLIPPTMQATGSFLRLSRGRVNNIIIGRKTADRALPPSLDSLLMVPLLLFS
jgi:hypothetical protein